MLNGRGKVAQTKGSVTERFVGVELDFPVFVVWIVVVVAVVLELPRRLQSPAAMYLSRLSYPTRVQNATSAHYHVYLSAPHGSLGRCCYCYSPS